VQNTKQYLCAASLIACCGTAFTASAAETTNTLESVSRPPYREWTVGAEAGTTGLGGFGAWRFSKHLGARAGFDYFQWTENDLQVADLHYNAKLRFMSEPLTLDIYPWKKHSFHISLGVLFNQNQLTGESTISGTVNIGGEEFQVSDVGSLHLKIEPQVVNPYLSIGGNLLYFDRAHRWALGGELGVAYTGGSSVSLTRTGPDSAVIDAAVRREQDKAQNWANQYQWLPVVKLVMTFSF
jgi:hypothetical protein